MLSRKYRRTLAFTLVLSAGALTLPPAEAATSRNAALNAGSAVQAQLTHLEVDALLDFLDFFHVLGLGRFS